MSGESEIDLGRLSEWMSARLGSRFVANTADAFDAGASNLTYRLETSDGTYVLRTKPRGKLVSSAHAIDREFRVLQALENTNVPTPRVYFYCDNSDVIGVEFYVMEHVAGRIYRDYSLAEVNKADRATIYDSMNDALAQLHRVDPAAIGLADYGRPGNYFQRQIDLWARQYQKQDQTVPEFERLAAWLTENLFQDDKPAIVHGDYTLHNIVLAPDEPKVAAILDWELSTLGHPLADLAYNLSQWYAPDLNREAGVVSLVDADIEALGIPSMETYAKTYAERRGIEIPLKHLYFSMAFSRYRLAGILIGILGRRKLGTSGNESGDAAETMLMPTIRQAWEFAKQADRCTEIL